MIESWRNSYLMSLPPAHPPKWRGNPALPFPSFSIPARPSLLFPSLLHYPTRRRRKSEVVNFRKVIHPVVRVPLPDRNPLQMLEDVNALITLCPLKEMLCPCGQSNFSNARIPFFQRLWRPNFAFKRVWNKIYDARVKKITANVRWEEKSSQCQVNNSFDKL